MPGLAFFDGLGNRGVLQTISALKQGRPVLFSQVRVMAYMALKTRPAVVRACSTLCRHPNGGTRYSLRVARTRSDVLDRDERDLCRRSGLSDVPGSRFPWAG